MHMLQCDRKIDASVTILLAGWCVRYNEMVRLSIRSNMIGRLVLTLQCDGQNEAYAKMRWTG